MTEFDLLKLFEQTFFSAWGDFIAYLFCLVGFHNFILALLANVLVKSFEETKTT